MKKPSNKIALFLQHLLIKLFPRAPDFESNRRKKQKEKEEKRRRKIKTEGK